MKRGRILIVEDERLVAEDLRDTLVNVGYEIAGVVASGERAVSQVGEHHPDLVLMDINLDGSMDGISAANLIRSRHGTPVVYLTAFANDHTLARARETDAFGFIVKPFQEKAVIAAIEMALGKRARERVQIREQELLRSGMMTLPLGLLMTDTHERIVFANSQARLHIGRDFGAADGVALADVFVRAEDLLGDTPDAPVGVADNELRGAVIEMTGKKLRVVYSEGKLHDDRGVVLGAIILYQDAEHPPFAGELGRLLRAFMQSTRTAGGGPAQFLTLCAWSKRVKVDDARWISFEDFLTHYLGLHVTHGMSPEVAQKWADGGFKDPAEVRPPAR